MIRNTPQRRTVAYTSVSSPDQMDELERQKQVLEQYCASQGWTVEVIADLGHKNGRKKLLEAIFDGQVERLVTLRSSRPHSQELGETGLGEAGSKQQI